MYFRMHTVTLLAVHYFISIKYVVIQFGIGNANQSRNICLCLQELNTKSKTLHIIGRNMQSNS